MKKCLLLPLILIYTSLQALSITSPAFKPHTLIPVQYALCQADGANKRRLAADISPALNWQHLPFGTKSLTLLVADPDAPQSLHTNIKDQWIKKYSPRQTVYHWVLIDISTTLTGLPQGAGSTGYQPSGKPIGQTHYGITGKNIVSYMNKESLESLGSYKTSIQFGDYDGPCPPFNDMKKHRYQFTLYALNVPSLHLRHDGNFTGLEVIQAMKSHVLGKTMLTGLYSTNQKLLSKKQAKKLSREA
jgi:Raf kinase inhibitor-like YbhB/YbcL family protein